MQLQTSTAHVDLSLLHALFETVQLVGSQHTVWSSHLDQRRTATCCRSGRVVGDDGSNFDSGLGQTRLEDLAMHAHLTAHPEVAATACSECRPIHSETVLLGRAV